MTADEYINSIVNHYRVPVGHGTPSHNAASAVYPIIRQWAGGQLREVVFSGSYAKGTGVRGLTDVDVFISLKDDTSNTLREIFNTLHSAVVSAGYSQARKQNVSIHLNHAGIDVDLVPGIKHVGHTEDHWLYVNRAGRERIQTDINKHIQLVKNSGRISEIIAMKVWKKNHGIDIPSFYLELAILSAMQGKGFNQIANNVLSALSFLSSEFVALRLEDPSNTNNIISDDLTMEEKRCVAAQANRSLRASKWDQIIW